VEYGLKACSNVPDNYAFLDTLAAAYARDGQFEKAVETQAKAIELVENAMSFNPYRKALADRLELYKKKEMYVDEDGDGQ
jgi:hypothetical protein